MQFLVTFAVLLISGLLSPPIETAKPYNMFLPVIQAEIPLDGGLPVGGPPPDPQPTKCAPILGVGDWEQTLKFWYVRQDFNPDTGWFLCTWDYHNGEASLTCDGGLTSEVGKTQIVVKRGPFREFRMTLPTFELKTYRIFEDNFCLGSTPVVAQFQWLDNKLIQLKNPAGLNGQ